MSNNKHIAIDPIVYAHTVYLEDKMVDKVPPVFNIKKTYMMSYEQKSMIINNSWKA